MKLPVIGSLSPWAMLAMFVAVTGVIGTVVIWDTRRIGAAEERGRLEAELKCRTTISSIQSEIDAANAEIALRDRARHDAIDAILEARRQQAAAEERSYYHEKELEDLATRACLLGQRDVDWVLSE